MTLKQEIIRKIEKIEDNSTLNNIAKLLDNEKTERKSNETQPHIPPTFAEMKEAVDSHIKWQKDVNNLLNEFIKWNNIVDPKIWEFEKRIEALEKTSKNKA